VGFSYFLTLLTFSFLPFPSIHFLAAGHPYIKEGDELYKTVEGTMLPLKPKTFSKERFIINVSQYSAFITNPTFILFSQQCCLFNISPFIRLIGITRSTVTHIKKPSLAVTQRGLIFLYSTHHPVSKFTVSYTKNTVFISNY
jgi:hypothetical protein